VEYTPDASPDAPTRLFLKLSNPALVPGDFDPSHLNQEIVFYQTVAPAMKTAFTIPCYHLASNLETGASHILLKDVSETHDVSLSPACRSQCELAIDALAGLHAYWWDHPRLGKDVGSFPGLEQRQQELLDTQRSTMNFMSALGADLHAAWRANYEHVLSALPHLFQRHATGRNLTLVHGDAHLGNFLFPREPEGGGAFILDWQFWHATIAGTDLAFMMATDWEPPTRRLLERRLVERYYAGLLAHGVRNYAWDDCWNDYRLSVILVSIFIPVWRWSLFHWVPDLPALTNSMTAFEDLHCAELLPF
jgi:hypothetical protein